MISWIKGRKGRYEEIPSEPHYQILTNDQEEIYITSYRSSILKKWIFYLFNFPLFGAAILLLEWFPRFIYLKYVRSSLKDAEYVLVKDSNNIYFVHPVLKVRIESSEALQSLKKSLHSFLNSDNDLRYFMHKELKYVWLYKEMQFFSLRGCSDGKVLVKDLLNKTNGYTAEEEEILLKIYGRNEIKVVIESHIKILIRELLRPIYLFQVFAIIVWVANDYLCYAACVICLSGCTIFFTVFSTRKERLTVQNLVLKSTAFIASVVRKNGQVENVSPFCLVPGDIIQIPQNGCIMPCDALLLHGNCIVNESTLTGENSHAVKMPPFNNDEVFNCIILKNHVLFCGTRVLQTRYYGKGMVTALTINTGFSTIKGDLVRCLLHPKPLGFKFYEDTIIFVICLFITASCGILYLIYISLLRDVPTKTIVLDSLDLITIVVPPSLTAALTAGTLYAKKRLSAKGIFCMSPPKINLFGKLKLMCFDKTGTLTEDGLNLCGIIPSNNKKFKKLIDDPSILDPKHPIVVNLATCHSLTKINGKISGDQLDLSMFNSINWDLSEPGKDTCRYDLLCPTIVKPKNYYNSNIFYDQGKLLMQNGHCSSYLLKSVSDMDAGGKGESLAGTSFSTVDFENNELPYEIGIVREFPFSSSCRCMSVITRELGSDHMNLYCKGAPEKIYELCIPESLPENFNHQLQIHAAMGFRIIALAYREFDKKFNWKKSQRVHRQEIEVDLIFLGFVIMQNKLKAVSTSVIDELREANIRCVMVTGDNLLTALSVSRECLMILPGDQVLEVKVGCSGRDGAGPRLIFRSLEMARRKESNSSSKTSKSSRRSSRTRRESPYCHYVLDGKTWELLRTHFTHSIPKIIIKGTVFARMLPEQKTQLIQAFQALDYIVGMCGDGANDFGAMKAAHVGVSLSETENSVAAPFTSKTPNISCIITLVQEGRCALVSTFVIFKYMAIYGLIQFTSFIVAYSKGVGFSNMEFLYVDFIVTSLLAIVIGRTGPARVIVKTRPITRLISVGNLLPLVLQVIVIFTIQVLALEFLYRQKWFVPVDPCSETVTKCWENTVIYCISLFQFLTLAMVYSKGKPYRQPFYKDVVFMVVVMSLTFFSALVCVYPFRKLADFLDLMPVEDDTTQQTLFRIQLLFIPLLNLVIAYTIESSISDRKWFKKLIHVITKKKQAKNRYKRICFSSIRQ